jgi:hypothetical protein
MRAQFFDSKFEAELSGHDGDWVTLKAFGGGQGWGCRQASVEPIVQAVFDRVFADCFNGPSPPVEVVNDIKAGIAFTLFEGERTTKWGG